jgi:hypothetical protein
MAYCVVKIKKIDALLSLKAISLSIETHFSALRYV